MGIFHKRKAKAQPPKGYGAVKFEFTPEEAEAVRLTHKMYGDIASLSTPDGMQTVVPEKVLDAITSRGLAEYVEDLMARIPSCASDQELLALMDKAIKAQMKAYAVHNLPFYLFQMAGMFELIGDLKSAREFFQLFLQDNDNFTSDDIDTIYMKQIGLDISKTVALAREKIR